jgi:hypothetical protein
MMDGNLWNHEPKWILPHLSCQVFWSHQCKDLIQKTGNIEVGLLPGLYLVMWFRSLWIWFTGGFWKVGDVGEKP